MHKRQEGRGEKLMLADDDPGRVGERKGSDVAPSLAGISAFGMVRDL